ncbi:MAG: class I adenylate-forming enzyme family protein [Candidatus Binatia bacterium]
MAKNFAALLEETSRRFADKTALAWDGGTLTYAELDRSASGFACLLAERGLRAGDRVCISLPNHWTFAVAVLAGLKMGARVSPINVLLKSQEREEILDALKPHFIIQEVEARESLWETAADIDSPALITYTSGSTGKPKGVLVSHEALAFATRSWAGPVMRLTPEDVVLAALPLAHAYGLPGALLAALSAGAKVVIVERFSPETVLETVKRQRVTVFPGVATMFLRLLASPAFRASDLSSLRLAVSGAAPCPWELVGEWRERTGSRILRGYGMTELFRPVSYLSADPMDLPDAVGRAVPGVQVKVVNDGGKSLSDGEVGELWVKTPAAMDGYLDDPEETQAVLSDGWFKTGDLATVLPGGFIQIAGRKRERILRGGYSVFSPEVEGALLSHPSVVEAAVIGTPSVDLGEEVVGFVSLKPGVKTTPGDLINHCKERLAAYKYPRRVIVLEQLPKGSTGKIDKSRLRNFIPS